MKILNFLLLISMLILETVQVNGQDLTKEADTEKNAVLRIMKSYQEALQNLTTEGTLELFSEDSEVIESGGVEGSFENYIKYHLGPELEDFETFDFSNYDIDVKINLPYAFTTETYVYTIKLKPDDKGEKTIIKREGVTTSILKQKDGKWKIYKTHSSSRNYR